MSDDWGDIDDGDEDPHDGDILDASNEKIEIDNLFYQAEDSKRRAPEQARIMFDRLDNMIRNKEMYKVMHFKVLEHAVLLDIQLGRERERIMEKYQELLSFAALVTRNEFSDSINKVLNHVGEADASLCEKVYEMTLSKLKALGNQERMWFQTNIKLCRLYIANSNVAGAIQILQDLHQSCLDKDGRDDKSKGSQLLEIYALEFSIYSDSKDNAKLKELFHRTKDLSAEINDPRSMSVIHECWGKMYANESKWALAFGEFFSAFKLYQEIGMSQAKQCLKYVVISGLLAHNQANPFDAQEAKVYEKLPEIQAMVNLRSAYERGDSIEMESILRQNSRSILDDSFIRQHLDEILRRVRLKTLADFVVPYTRVKISFLATKLAVSESEIEALLIRLILEENIIGKIDQIEGVLDLTPKSIGNQKFLAFQQWITALEGINHSLANRM